MSTFELKLGVDFVTLYDSDLWGAAGYDSLFNPQAVPPERFWDRALDIVGSTGVQGVELTTGVADYRSALARYQTPEGFVSALGDRGLRLCSGFYTGLFFDADQRRRTHIWHDPVERERILREVAEYAEFVAAAGGVEIVISTPPRTSWDAPEPVFVDLDHMKSLADMVNQMGYVARSRGVGLAVHPKAQGVCWFRRDINLLLSLTDPVYVDFCPDTAQIALGGTNPVDVLIDQHERVPITHWKDYTGTISPYTPIDDHMPERHHPLFAPVGQGKLDWAAWAGKLIEVGFSGWSIIELDASPDPAADIAAARRYIEDLVSELQAEVIE